MTNNTTGAKRKKEQRPQCAPAVTESVLESEKAQLEGSYLGRLGFASIVQCGKGLDIM